MKKMLITFLIGMTTFLFVGCGGSSDNGAPVEVSVNHIGTWQVISTMTGNTCEGLTSEQIQTIEPLDGNMERMGLLYWEGTDFRMTANGSCELVDSSGTVELNAPSIMTKNEFRDYEWNDFPNKDEIARFEITNYTQQSYSLEIEYTNGVVFYQTYNRQQ